MILIDLITLPIKFLSYISTTFTTFIFNHIIIMSFLFLIIYTSKFLLHTVSLWDIVQIMSLMLKEAHVFVSEISNQKETVLTICLGQLILITIVSFFNITYFDFLLKGISVICWVLFGSFLASTVGGIFKLPIVMVILILVGYGRMSIIRDWKRKKVDFLDNFYSNDRTSQGNHPDLGNVL